MAGLDTCTLTMRGVCVCCAVYVCIDIHIRTILLMLCDVRVICTMYVHGCVFC